jgi:hypothetical protein
LCLINFSVKINLVKNHIKFVIEIDIYKIYEQKQKKYKATRIKNLIKKSTFKQETNLIYINFFKKSHMNHTYLFKN